MPLDAEGYAGVWHANNPPAWTGPSGYYKTDFRTYLAPSQAMTWSPIHVWASDGYLAGTMAFSIQGSDLFPPPLDREYSLQLLSVPKSVTGAPALGTTWAVPAEGPLTVVLPTYRDVSGEDAYKFAFTVSEVVPEPASVLLLLVVATISRPRQGQALLLHHQPYPQ